MGKIGLFDLEKHFALYLAYHGNPKNIVIHMLSIWPIFFTFLLILYFTPSLFNPPGIEFSLFGSKVASSFVARWLGFSLAWKKREPALPENLVQAFVMAPLFVLLEALQTVCGYEPYPGFYAIVQAEITAEISEWQAKEQLLLA